MALKINDPFAGLAPEDVLISPIVKSLYDDLLSRQSDFDWIDRYMDGKHDLSFATEKFVNAFGSLFREFSENYCPRVISALADYVQLLGIKCYAGTDKTKGDAVQDAIDDWLSDQKLALKAGQVHNDCFRYGNAYVILAEDLNSDLRIYRQDSRTVICLYDVEIPDQIICALKVWKERAGTYRLNVYTLTGTYRYATLTRPNANPKMGSFTPCVDSGGAFDANLISNLLPVFHFANEPDGQNQGVTELRDIRRLQDALNKSVVDMLVAMEFQAFRQRWATGIEIEFDEKGKPKVPFVPAIDRLWIAPGADAKFGDFEPIDLNQFIAVSEKCRMNIARLARIPLHHLAMSENFPSGEALKTAETPVIAKSRDRQLCWGATWEALGNYFCQWKNLGDGSLKCEADWKDVTPRARQEETQADLNEANALTAKKALGVPTHQLFLEMDYTDEQIEQFKEWQAEEDEEANEKMLQNMARPGSLSIGGRPGIVLGNQQQQPVPGQALLPAPQAQGSK